MRDLGGKSSQNVSLEGVVQFGPLVPKSNSCQVSFQDYFSGLLFHENHELRMNYAFVSTTRKINIQSGLDCISVGIWSGNIQNGLDCISVSF